MISGALIKRAAVWLAALQFFFAPFVAAQESDFYRGKTIRIVVGFSPGGGYDANARLLSRYLGAHIPGRPNVIVENMLGAGSLRAANYVYGMAPKDGTVIAAVNVNAPMYQLLGGEGAQFDATRLQWLGSITHSNDVVYVWAATGIRSIADAKAREVTLGGVGKSSDGYIDGTILNALLETRFKVILGYPGSNEMRLAIERGELMGRGGSSYASLAAETPAWLTEHKISILVQFGREKEPELPDVPLLSALAASEEARQIAAIVSAPSAMGYGYWLAPEVPTARVDILRAAFEASVTDEGLRKEAATLGLRPAPQSAAATAASVRALADTPQKIRDRIVAILGWRN